MAVRREFFCPGHGSFESDQPRCPRGCSVSAEREFLTAPAVHGRTTALTDKLVRSQVEAFGLSDLRSAREGETSRPRNPQADKMAEFQKSVRARYPKFWGDMPKGEGAVPAVLGAHHAEPTQGIDKAALESARPPIKYIRDPENLKVKTG